MKDERTDPKGLAAVLAEHLTRVPCLQPLAAAEGPPASADIAQYNLFELADSISVRCAANIDPDDLQNAELRAHWTQRALDGETLDEPFVLGRRPYWVVDSGERIGTVAFAVSAAEATTLEVSSVYVRPKHRRQGWASRVLRTLTDAAFDLGFQRIALQVEWNNQDALRFYCAQGMWVAGWNKAIELHFAKDLPSWHIEVQDNEARFRVKGRIAAVAQNQGDRLGWILKKTTDSYLRTPLQLTAALQLALMRWPIIRTDKLWQDQLRSGGSEHGSFEALALRLRQYERHIRRRGWNLPPEPNPSFASLTTLVDATALLDRLDVRLSDGTPSPSPSSPSVFRPTKPMRCKP